MSYLVLNPSLGRCDLSCSRLVQLARLGRHGIVDRLPCVLAVKTWRDADAVIVVLAGELDLAVAESFRAGLRRAMGEPRPRLILDLGGLSFIDSSGLHTILGAYEQCCSAGTTLSIRPGPPNVQQVFELTNTLDYLPFESRA